MTQILILGCGMVGSTMALDLAQDRTFDIRIADRSTEALALAKKRIAAACGCEIETVQADLSVPSIVTDLAREADQVLGALSSIIGFQTLRAVIESGTNYCDISFMPEDFLELGAIAQEQGVTAVCDCGVAPGLSNMLAGYGLSQLDECRNIEIYVGGIPKDPKWPFNYKAAFSPYDVIEEYTRPSRLVERGEVVVREALSEPEIMSFDRVGELEAFNTDGLRSLISTLDVPDMKEKTLRYPGHIELMRVFRETGLFSHEAVEIEGVRVRPIDFTSAVLFPKWKYDDGEADLTVMRVIVEGSKSGEDQRLEWSLYDEYAPDTGCSSMSRTTAFPATQVARMMLDGTIEESGVLAPEQLGMMDGVTERVIAGLIGRGVEITHTDTRATRTGDPS